MDTDLTQKVLTLPEQTGQGVDGTSRALAVEDGTNIRATTLNGITNNKNRFTN
jgi:hypothetical protein